MGRRTLLLIAAVLLAAVGTGVLFLYVTSIADPEPTGGSSGTAVAPATTIPAGATITESTRFVEVPVDAAAITEGNLVTDRAGLVGRIANRELLAYQPLSEAQFGGAVQQPSVVNLDGQGGFLAVTVEVEDAARNADLLRAGSMVAVWVVDPQTGAEGAGRHEARLILPSVEVLTIGSNGTIQTGQRQDDDGAAAGSAALVTLQVNQDQAGKIMVADTAGELRLTLLGPDTVPTPKTYGERVLDVP